jgi:hypothetical protein
MTCMDMGGPCEHTMTAETSEEMIKMGGDHVMSSMDEAHMKIAEEMKVMTPENTKEWHDSFMTKWDQTPTSESETE